MSYDKWLPAKVKRKIRQEAWSDPAENPPEVADRIEEWLKANSKRVIPRNTILKGIREARRENGPEDRPWTIHSLSDHPVAPDAVAVLLKVWARLQIERHPSQRRMLTIREALWVARIHCVFRQDAFKDEAHYLENLWHWAWNCSVLERELRGEKDYPTTREGILPYWGNDANLHKILTAKETPTWWGKEMTAGVEASLDWPSFLCLLKQQEDGLQQIQEVKEGKREILYAHRKVEGPIGTLTYEQKGGRRPKGGKKQ